MTPNSARLALEQAAARGLNLVLSLALLLLVAACRPVSPPEPSSPQQPPETKTDRAPLRRALRNIQSSLSHLEGRLKISDAQTWTYEASVAQRDLGDIRRELGTLKAGSLKVAALEYLLSDLDEKLRGASAENWNQNASAAQHIVGNLWIELQALSRSLPGTTKRPVSSP